MTNLEDVILKRIAELRKASPHQVAYADLYFGILNLATLLYGKDSPQVEALKRIKEREAGEKLRGDLRYLYNELVGVLSSFESDLRAGLVKSLQSQLQSEILGDFVVLAKRALDENQKDVAAVLACAALEDSLKKYATVNGLQVDDKSMQEVLNALKSKGLISGAQKGLVAAFPRIRDYAMHANWDKIAPEDVRSVIGFVEQFLLTRFSGGNATLQGTA